MNTPSSHLLISTIEIAIFLAIFETYLDISSEHEIKELEDRVDKLHEGMRKARGCNLWNFNTSWRK
jgi:hypothetical protein